MRPLVLLALLSACSGGGGGGTAGGSGTTAGGSGSTAGGSGATAGGSGATAGGSGSTAGGSGATAGGSGATAGGSGATAGGSGATAGGSSTGGVGTFLRVGMFDIELASGSDGRMHMLFSEGAAERAFYGSCVSNCSAAASWSPVQLASIAQLNLTALGAEGIGVDSTGRVHALISGVPVFGAGNVNSSVYLTCASNCGVAASWTQLDLSSVAVENSIGTASTFMVSPSGGASFLTRELNGQARWVGCASNCGTLSSWSAGNVIAGNPMHARLDGAGITHVIYNGGTTMMGDNLLFYARCASGCAQGASWQASAVGFIHRTPSYESSFAVTASGKLFVAYNQGIAMAGTADNRKLLVNTCQTPNNCLDLNTWASFSLGVQDEGDDGTWLEAAGEELGLASTRSFDLNVYECTANCGAAAGWGTATVVDTNAAITQVIHPATGSSCPSSSESAAWWPNSPVIAAGPAGIVIAHSPYAIVKCPGITNPSRLPPIGRIITTF